VPQPRLKDRNFISIDPDNFDEVMKGIEPRAVYRVSNELSVNGGEFAVELKFRSMEDFRPESVVQQVEPLRKLLEARTKLADLRNKIAGNDKLEDILSDVLSSTEKLAELGKQHQQIEEFSMSPTLTPKLPQVPLPQPSQVLSR
jgi:type VI secretion system protein ImpB